MLVINGNRPKMSGAERAVIDWLHTVPASGIAISGCHIPDRDGRHSQEADLVLFTPEAVVGIEVKGILKRRAAGVLSCAVNSRWHLPGVDGDPIHVRGGDTNPLEQLAGVMFNLKHVATQATSHEVFVVGLVLVVPNDGAITLDKGPVPMPTGRDVLLGGDPDDLVDWLNTARRRPQAWTADLVHTVLTALGLADAVTRDALRDEGFPASLAPESGGAVVVDLYPTAPSRPTAIPPRSIAPQPATPTRRRVADHDLGRSPAAVSIPSIDLAPPTGNGPANRNAHRAPVRSLVLAGAAISLLVGGSWILANTADQAGNGNSHEPGSAVVNPQPADAPASPAVEDAPPPHAPPRVVPAPKPPCFPFQQGC
ncbi:hypothetical protein ACIBJI_41935 [Nocardia sp. NPDC050408]|uniref:hypothetical protein n=1 Tax=Nocardia sp. NPDC050408 TaxID=3364319 RepID=UPI0037994CCF